MQLIKSYKQFYYYLT